MKSESMLRNLAVLSLLCLLGGCDQPKASREPSRSAAQPAPRIVDNGQIDRGQAGLPAPDAAFRDPEGEPVKLADFSGRPVLLNLWATWCAPCVAEMPTLDALAEREAGRISVITVSQDSGSDEDPAAAKVDAFFERMKFKQLGAFLDEDSAIMTQLGINILPTTILYDTAGKEVWRMTGELDWTGRRARRLIAEAK